MPITLPRAISLPHPLPLVTSQLDLSRNVTCSIENVPTPSRAGLLAACSRSLSFSILVTVWSGVCLYFYTERPCCSCSFLCPWYKGDFHSTVVSENHKPLLRRKVQPHPSCCAWGTPGHREAERPVQLLSQSPPSQPLPTPGAPPATSPDAQQAN